MSQEPESLMLVLLREMRAEISSIRSEMAAKNEIAELRSDTQSLRADVASDILGLHGKIDATRNELNDQIVGLRRAVVEYHTSAIGHGVLISEIEARLRRVEQHLDLPSGAL